MAIKIALNKTKAIYFFVFVCKTYQPISTL
jgi:hypothetical protein